MTHLGGLGEFIFSCEMFSVGFPKMPVIGRGRADEGPGASLCWVPVARTPQLGTRLSFRDSPGPRPRGDDDAAFCPQRNLSGLWEKPLQPLGVTADQGQRCPRWPCLRGGGLELDKDLHREGALSRPARR